MPHKQKRVLSPALVEAAAAGGTVIVPLQAGDPATWEMADAILHKLPSDPGTSWAPQIADPLPCSSALGPMQPKGFKAEAD